MNKKLLIFAVVVAVVGLGFIALDFAPQLLSSTAKNLQDFKRSDFGQALQEIGKEIVTPPPLNIGGLSNNAQFSAEQIIIETNAQRNANGNLPALTYNAKLAAAAKAKAEDMFAKQYFEHISPDGTDPGELVKAHGYDYMVAGENLILGNFNDEKEIVQLWMNSPGHRANILNTRFTEIGVAIIKGTYKGKTAWIGVQEFGTPISDCKEADNNLRTTIDTNKASLAALAEKIDAKKAEIDRTSRKSEQYNTLIDEYNALVAEYNQLNEVTKNDIAKYNAQVNAFNNCVSGNQ